MFDDESKLNLTNDVNFDLELEIFTNSTISNPMVT